MATTITSMSREMTPVERYLLTKSQSSISLKDVEDGTEIIAEAYITYTTTKQEKGESKEYELLAILTPAQEVYTTISATFTSEFLDMWYDCHDEVPDSIGGLPIIKKNGISKNGREFITCVLDIAKMA